MLAGSCSVSAAVALGVDPRLEGACATFLLWVVVVGATAYLRDASLHADGAPTPAGFALPSRAVLLIGALCFLVMTTEGAVADWAGIYLTGETRGRVARRPSPGSPGSLVTSSRA